MPAILELVLLDEQLLHGGRHAQREEVTSGELHEEGLELLPGLWPRFAARHG
jgi:hypothetical protein